MKFRWEDKNIFEIKQALHLVTKHTWTQREHRGRLYKNGGREYGGTKYT
jgi:hypothetical protein